MWTQHTQFVGYSNSNTCLLTEDHELEIFDESFDFEGPCGLETHVCYSGKCIHCGIDMDVPVSAMYVDYDWDYY